MKKLAIIGAGELGKQIAHFAKLCNYEVVGYFDDVASKKQINNIPVLGTTETIFESYSLKKFDFLFVAIGYKHMEQRELVFQKFKNKIPFANIIHPSSIIDTTARLGEGIIIYPKCIIDINVEINDNALLNNGCIISHDSVVGSGSFLAPAVIFSGFVKTESLVNLGTGTTVSDNIKISRLVKTGAGTVVVKNLLKKGVYIGCPAKLIE